MHDQECCVHPEKQCRAFPGVLFVAKVTFMAGSVSVSDSERLRTNL